MTSTLSTCSQDALTLNGIRETVRAAGILAPRHQHAGALVGGLVGSVAGDAFGGLGEAVASVAGARAGSVLSSRGSGLPERVILVVTDRSVLCFTRGFVGGRPSPDRLILRLSRETTTVRIRQRPSFRIIELSDAGTGSVTALEAHRFAPQAGGLIAALREPAVPAIAR